MLKPLEVFIDYQLKQVEYEKGLENKIVQLVDTILKTLNKHLLKVYYNELSFCIRLEDKSGNIRYFLASINIVNGKTIEITIFKLPCNHIIDFINTCISTNVKALEICSRSYTEVYKLQTTFKTDDSSKLIFSDINRKSNLSCLSSSDKESLINYLTEAIEGEKGI